ncbi:DUF4974 domain-containing protein [Fulvivirga sp. RKSG066]|uniref:FecR family protein n=1 Tax=Fulvivirga aurantia TaxID=2529383 RepID=UPI0012BD54A3|nr:FecR domain-containing protein [Fulvivirga aurantia]MTI22932.1 DUF4974 domain-containing protein [Fulvivirga aurantia]
MADDQFIKDWLEGKVSASDLDKAKKSDESVEDFEEIIAKSQKLNVPRGKSKAEAWNDFVAKIDEKEAPKAKVRKLNPAWPIGIAAAISLAIVAYLFLFSSTTISTAPGNRLAHVLPDGSTVTLNADSKISYNESNWLDDRSVKLDGEAFFEVTEGSSFVVEGNQTSVTVLGTSFNVYLRNDDVKVQCFTGKVNVAKNDKNIILEKGQATGNELELRSFDSLVEATWRSGEFHFKNQPLTEVIKELERQYDIEVEYDLSTQRQYTGYFNDKDLNEALQFVFKPMGLSYEIKDDKVIVK